MMKHFGVGILILFELTFPRLGFAKTARVVRLTDKQVATIYLKLGRTTVLSFPSKPTKVLLGSKNQFSIDYVDSDLAVSALTPGAVSNLFVYLPERRYAFDLVTVQNSFDSIVEIKDSHERQIKIEAKP